MRSTGRGSNRRRSTTVPRTPKASWSAAYPQVWNSGAAMNIFSPWRSGMRDSIAASGPNPPGCRRRAPFGVPVVPEVSTIVCPGRAGGARSDTGAAAISPARVGVGRRASPSAEMRRTAGGTAATSS